jgi:protease-4
MNTLLQILHSQLWFILPPAWHALEVQAQALEEKLRIVADMVANHQAPINEANRAPNVQRPTMTYLGDPIPAMEMRKDVAIVPVIGTLLKGASGFQKWAYGVRAHEDIHEDLSKSLASGARAILLNVNSPGGTVIGTAGVADRVREIVKAGTPVVSFTENQSCSAAEFLTGACSARFATSDAIVGSIGTMMGAVSIQKMLEKEGVDYQLFTSGKFKGMGHIAKDMTEEQKNFLQGFVSARADEFKSHMRAFRPSLPDHAMEGQIFTGREASANGLLDGTMGSIDEALAFLG